jgi:hypothetical protein
MAQRQGTSWFRITGFVATSFAAALLLGTNAVSAGPHGNGHHDDPGYKGTASLNVIAVAPNPERCGDPPTFELTFEGSGLDTAGGITSIEASACQNVATGEVFDLVAVDTYPDGDTINIVSDSFYFVLDPETCVSTNIHPVRFDVDGGTGIFEGIAGGGKYDIAFNDPSCNGEVTPAFISFRGHLH